MKRSLRFLTVLSLFILAFAMFLWLLLPWQDTGKYLMGRVRHELVQGGVYLDYSGLKKEHYLEPVFSISEVSARYLMGEVRVEVIRVRPDIISSIMSLKPSFTVDMGKGSVFMGEEEKGSFKEGRLLVRILPEKLFLEEVDFKGDISISGDAFLDLKEGKIISAAMGFKVPEELEMFLKAFSGGAGLKKSSSGEWKLVTGKRGE